MAVLEQLGNRVFTQAAAVDHFNGHVIHSVVCGPFQWPCHSLSGMEIDHLSALTRRVVRAYIAMRINT